MGLSNERHLDVLMAGEAQGSIKKQVQLETDWAAAALKLPPHNDFWETWRLLLTGVEARHGVGNHPMSPPGLDDPGCLGQLLHYVDHAGRGHWAPGNRLVFGEAGFQGLDL